MKITGVRIVIQKLGDIPLFHVSPPPPPSETVPPPGATAANSVL